MRIRETIDHGQYRSVREIEIDMSGRSGILVEPERVALLRMGETSPYRFAFNPYTNSFHTRALMDLRDTGKCTIGWATFEKVPAC